MPALSKRSRWLLIGLSVALLLAAFIVSRNMCLGAWLSHGLVLDECPDGEVRQVAQLQASGLVRGKPGPVSVHAIARYAVGLAERQANVTRFTPTVFLVDHAGKETALEPEKPWADGDAKVTLPAVPDGDYLLRAKVKSRLGESTVDAALALYAPARVHVLTDRPLYKPGDTVRFRALVLRAADLTPLDGRPGTWFVESPAGEVVLEERSPAGDWGVVASSFPLDRGAAEGDWKVRWTSGGATDEAHFRVQPFVLPRFRIEASAPRPFYRSGDRPKLEGSVTYSSGAPVVGAALEIQWQVAGDWPPPTSWLEKELPKRGKTDPNGRFGFELPQVPPDLRGKATLTAQIAAVDPAGDRVEGAAGVLLSEDAIDVSAVTELNGGLVAGSNNRMYLRVTSAAAEVLAGSHLLLRRAWDTKDKGLEAVADEDGVAAFQVDPGPAVNVVIPPMPVRRPPRPKVVVRSSVQEQLGGQEPSLADQLAMDRWNPALEPCARWAESSQSAAVALEVDPGGAIAVASGPADHLSQCVARTVRAQRLPPGKSRFYSVSYAISGEELPKLEVQPTATLGGVPAELEKALADGALDARSCLPLTADATEMPRLLAWKLSADGKRVAFNWMADPQSEPPRTPEAQARCIEAKLQSVKLPGKPKGAEAEDDDEESPTAPFGFARIRVEPSAREQQERPQATTLLGYEFRVSARNAKGELGSTLLRLRPGELPPARVRATPVLARAGETVKIELLRGPGFSGELPKKLYLTGGPKPIESDVDAKARSASFALPADANGWLEVTWAGARALVYVQPKDALAVEVTPAKAQYAPGQSAVLKLKTELSGQGTSAAVGVFGVDQSLSQLVALPGADELSRLRPKVTTPDPAFGVLDGQALSMGRIRGANAAAATITRVSAVPSPCETESPASTGAIAAFDSNGVLTDHFYGVLAELHDEVRAWEEKAPAGEQMHPPKMAQLWEQALDACAKRGEPVADVYGRRLRLSQLPQDLLALTDPRQVVVEGTRLPEDVESWSAWVAKEKP